MTLGTFSYIVSPFMLLNRMFSVDFSLPITRLNFLVSKAYWAYYLSLYMASQKIGVPSDVLILNPSI